MEVQTICLARTTLQGCSCNCRDPSSGNSKRSGLSFDSPSFALPGPPQISLPSTSRVYYLFPAWLTPQKVICFWHSCTSTIQLDDLACDLTNHSTPTSFPSDRRVAGAIDRPTWYARSAPDLHISVIGPTVPQPPSRAADETDSTNDIVWK